MERRFWVSARKQSQQGGGSLDGLCRTRQTRLGASLGRRTIPGQLVLAVALLSLNACVQASEWGQDSYDSTETEAASFVVDNESTSSVLGLDIDTVWWESNSTPGFRGQSYAVAPTTSDNSKPARFWFKLSQGGCFEVSARWTSGENRSKAVLFRGQNQNGTAVGQVEVDQSRDGARWNKLGQWNFSAGRGSVAVGRTGELGTYVVADAIRLTRCGATPVEDAPQVPNAPPAANANSVDLAVPYFYQYNNAYEGSATCGITSAAMAINYWLPNNLTPDAIYVEYGKSKGQSPEGIASISRGRGLKAMATRSGTREQIRSHLRAGRPVVVHGFWTGPGHIAVITGFDSTGWIANDPAGDWEVCYGCGTGKRVRYGYGGGWDQKLSYDGDIWFSASDKQSF